MEQGDEAPAAGCNAIYLSSVGSDMNVRDQNHRGQHQTHSHGSSLSPERILGLALHEPGMGHPITAGRLDAVGSFTALKKLECSWESGDAERPKFGGTSFLWQSRAKPGKESAGKV